MDGVVSEIADECCGGARMHPCDHDADTAAVSRRRKLVSVSALAAVGLLTAMSYLVELSSGAELSRTVLVADSAKPLPRHPFVAARDCLGSPATCQNGKDGIVLVYSLKGAPPRTPMLGRVRTDENCEADRHGVSHCLNEIVLIGNNRRITVRHDHHMHDFSCLALGERVRVLALAVALRA